MTARASIPPTPLTGDQLAVLHRLARCTATWYALEELFPDRAGDLVHTLDQLSRWGLIEPHDTQVHGHPTRVVITAEGRSAVEGMEG